MRDTLEVIVPTSLKPWREIAIPHSDVLKGSFQQAEFAADITAVRLGKADPIYQDAAAFYGRTFITEGMRLLLTQVAQRLAGRGGEPVIQLQTAFGGGKTHTMVAVWHLATRRCPLSDMPGLATLIEQAGLMEVPEARVAVIDGTNHGPGQPWVQGKQAIRTLWGELAWQLGGAEGFQLVAESDAAGTSPGKEVLQTLLERFAPCVVLMDELVAYIGQLEESRPMTGGTFESNVAFIQALTEAVKLVPNAIVLASLPESEVEVGSDRGVLALKALEKRFGRVQALWRPVGTEESFEIVRRRLFEPIRDEEARDKVCKAYARMYADEGAVMPGETQEARYGDRIRDAYPIHPEVFDRLYEDWTTIDGFQRTRGVLKLMAKVIRRLWTANNGDLMIMPASLPLADNDVRNELTYLLAPGWEPVIESDIDGDRADTAELEAQEVRFGQVQAARRVARTLFLGSAPPDLGSRSAGKGLDMARILLGCLQPGQSSALYVDALRRLADRLHFLNANGEPTESKTRYWFDTRANLRREMEDRRRRFEGGTEERRKIDDVVRRLFTGASSFDGIHVFPMSGDVPDDSALRLVVLLPEHLYVREHPTPALEAAQEYLRSHGGQPRHRANRLMFIAADAGSIGRLRSEVRRVLAWKSIVEDVEGGRLNIDQFQKDQAKTELRAAENALPSVARECFRWLLCPVQFDAAGKSSLEAYPISTSDGSSAGVALDRVCAENELIIGAWSPLFLRDELLKTFYWKADKPSVPVRQLWEDMQRYLYMPRLRTREVLTETIRKGGASEDFFGTALGKVDDRYEGFSLSQPISGWDDALLLIEPAEAMAYKERRDRESKVVGPTTDPTGGGNEPSVTVPLPPSMPPIQPPVQPSVSTHRSFRGAVSVRAAGAKAELNQIAQEIIALLARDPHADIRVTLEIDATFAKGAADDMRRNVSENATTLGFTTREWE